MNKLQILVVEDDKSVRNLMSTTLKAHDYKYIVAKTEKKPFFRHPLIIRTLHCLIWDFRIWMGLR